VLNNNQLKAAAENVATMAAVQATVALVTDLTLLVATTTAVTTATTMAMATLTLMVTVVTVAMASMLRVSCSQQAVLRVSYAQRSL
jgi:hypothetical protein